MVKVWLGNITPLLESSKLEHYYNQLPDHRREKANRQSVPLKKAQSVGAWILWSNMKEQYGLREESIYNLSHSGELVMCAALIHNEAATQRQIADHLPESDSSRLKDARLGCDIERIREINDKLPERFFALSEIERIKQEPTKEGQREVFFRLWVLKESYMKATRQGMKLDMRNFEIELGDQRVILKQPKEHCGQVNFYELPINNQEYRAAVCTTSEWIDRTVYEFDF